MIIKKIIQSCLIVVFVAAITFFIHFKVNASLEDSIEINQLLYSYIINVLLVCTIFAPIYLLKRRLKDQLGFIFMLASVLKFTCFFIFFYPEYNADGNLTRLEFLTFFIPYIICLITESVILSKFFNSLDNLNS